nr:MAG TPA: Neck appendage protein [Caudoviricetes sp.]
MTTFEQAMLARDRTLAVRVGKYNSSDINEAAFSYGYIAGDTFKPGGTCAGSGKIIFSSIITTFKKLDKIYPEIGLLVDDTYEWVKMGEYYINDIKIDRNRSKTELELMDGMFKFNQPYVSALNYPAQIRDVIREICEKTGVDLQTDDLGLRAIQQHIPKKPDKKDITFREVLSQAVQLLGFSAFFNRDGKLEIRSLTESSITITADNYFLHGLTKSETEYQIAGITCKKKDKEILTAGLRTGRSLELENSFMNQNILDDLYYDLKNLKYYPFNLNYQGHLKLQVGQWVTIKTNKNETFRVPVLSQSFNFKGGLSSRISADSKAGSDTQYNYSGFVRRQINQVATDIEAEVQQQLEWVEKEFDKKQNGLKDEIKSGIEQAKAKVEEVKSEINQSIEQKLQQTKSEVVDKVKQDFNQGLANANSEIGKVKQDLTNLQSSSEATITQLKSDLASQLGDKASKSEVKQTADGIREEISRLSTASRNYILNSDMTTATDRTTGTGLPLSPDLIRTLNAERSFTLSVDVVAQNMVAKNDKKRFGISYELKFSDGSNLWTEVFQKSDTALTRISQNFVLPAGKQIVSIAGGLYFQATGQIKLSRPKWGIGHNNKEWIKAVEDTDEQITAARTIFEKTAEGLKTDMAAVKSYVADDGKRREQLEQYTRTETARSAEALRKQASESYVAKSQYSEDARGVARRFEELNLNGTNLLPNTDFKNLVDVGNQFTVGGKTYKVKTLDKWYSSYNDGIPNPKTNYHGYFNETKFSETVFEFNESNGVREWKGLPIFITSDSRYTVGKYIFSADVNATGLGTHLEVGFYYYNKSGMREFHAGRARKNITSVNSWSRISLELKINDDVDFTKEMGFYIYGYGFTSNSVLYFKRPKLTNTNWTPSVEDNKKYTETKIAEYKQTVDGEFKKLQSSVGEMVKKTDINITPGQISFGTGKVVNGKTIASFFVQNPESIEAITKLMRITGDLVVNGSITGQNLASKTITTANLAAGSVTTEVLAADAVTAKNMRVDYALINKLTADDALLNNLVAKQAFINKLSTIDFSATQIKGGLLKSLNDATTFDLTTGDIIFSDTEPSILRKKSGYPHGMFSMSNSIYEDEKAIRITLQAGNIKDSTGSDPWREATISLTNTTSKSKGSIIAMESGDEIYLRTQGKIFLNAEDDILTGKNGKGFSIYTLKRCVDFILDKTDLKNSWDSQEDWWGK